MNRAHEPIGSDAPPPAITSPILSIDGIADDLRAGRRVGKSYNYLSPTEADDNRQQRDFAYHDAAPPPRVGDGQQYDYLHEDQNRKHRQQQGRASGAVGGIPDGITVPPPQHCQDYTPQFADSASDEDEAWLQEQMAVYHAQRRAAAAAAAAKRAPPCTWKLANPGPIGLLGFGMTTVLLNLHNTGHWPLYSVVPAMGICYGGCAQLIAGLLEFVRGNTFACVAFTSYGAFWLSLVCVWMLPNNTTGGPPPVGPTPSYMLGVYLIIWGFFSFLMMLCTLRMNVAIFIVFFTVTLLFLLLGGANMAENPTAVKAAGYEGIVCGCSALYLAFAEIINEVWDRTLLPVIPMTQLLSWFGGGEKKSDEQQPIIPVSVDKHDSTVGMAPPS